MWVLIKKVRNFIIPIEFNLLAIVSGRILHIYKFDSKKISEGPFTPFILVPLDQEPKFVQVAKDSNICVFYE